MARRYSQINRGEEYKKALDNKRAYDGNKNKPTKRMQGGTRDRTRLRDRRELFYKPFGINTGSAFKGYAIMSGNPDEPSKAKFKENIVAKGRLLLTVPNEDAANWMISPANFKPAKVTVFLPNGQDPKYVMAKKTKLYYLKYFGDSSSCIFGAINDTEEYANGANSLKNDFRNDFKATKNFRVSCFSEKVAV